tara:strand:- start:596 stop:1396 length:801 start_codon:yes stop_codon:yes gene_type:complete
MNKYPIGIFDSGIGGLTIANSIKKALPNESIIYFGDTEHLPYGEKSKESIQNFSKKIITFLIQEKCKIIIIACNSASSFADSTVTKVAGDAIIINVIDPIIEEVIKINNYNNIGVIGTKATIDSNIYAKKINQKKNSVNVTSLATPLLAPMIEEGFINDAISEKIISNYLSNKKLTNIELLILACTHYPLIQKKIKKFYDKNVTVLDSASIVTNYISKKLKEYNLLNNIKKSKYHFYVSNFTNSFEKSAKFFFKETIKLEELKLFS